MRRFNIDWTRLDNEASPLNVNIDGREGGVLAELLMKGR